MDFVTMPLGVLLVGFLAYKTFFTVKQKTAVVIERLGKFQRIAQSGLQLKIPLIDQKAGDNDFCPFTCFKTPPILAKNDLCLAGIFFFIFILGSPNLTTFTFPLDLSFTYTPNFLLLLGVRNGLLSLT